jgi:PadR family transcriptional regulator PadR
MAFRSDLDALVLGVLQTGTLHGYEIAKRINGQGDTALRVKEGQLYPILHRLENEGLIEAEWIPSEGKPARKVYQLTASGVRKLADQRDAWRQFVVSVNSILVPEEMEVHHA